MRRVIFCICGGFLVAAFGVGCDHGVSEKELGEITYELPKIEGADKPFPLPPLGEPLPEEVKEKRFH